MNCVIISDRLKQFILLDPCVPIFESLSKIMIVPVAVAVTIVRMFLDGLGGAAAAEALSPFIQHHIRSLEQLRFTMVLQEP